MNRAPDWSVYLVTEPRDDLVQVVAAAVAGGVGVVQLRDKSATTAELVQQCTRLRRVMGPAVLIVNDDVDAAQHADGIHVGAQDTPPSVARDRLGPDAIIGWSINDLSQLERRDDVSACSYLAVSPVFATPTKPDHQPPQGLAGVRRLAAASPVPVIGIGGIDASNAADVVAAGAAGVAVVRAICADPDPEQSASVLRTQVDVGLRRREQSAHV